MKNEKNISKPANELIEIICPKCRFTKIIHFPTATLSSCPKCGTGMMIRELLNEGKSY